MRREKSLFFFGKIRQFNGNRPQRAAEKGASTGETTPLESRECGIVGIQREVVYLYSIKYMFFFPV